MGTWGAGLIENDHSADLLCDWMDDPNPDALREELERIIKACGEAGSGGPASPEDGCMVGALAVVVATGLEIKLDPSASGYEPDDEEGDEDEDEPDSIRVIARAFGRQRCEELKPLVLETFPYLVDPRCELAELWLDVEGYEWFAAMKSVYAALGGAELQVPQPA